MLGLNSIETVGGGLSVRISLYGRPEISRNVEAGELIRGLSLFEKAFDIGSAERQNPHTHNKVRTKLVMVIENALDGKVGPVPAEIPVIAAYGVVWCLVNHYRDADNSRRGILRYLEATGMGYIGMVTTLSDQVAFSISERDNGRAVDAVIGMVKPGATLGVSTDAVGEVSVTAYSEAPVH